MPPSEYRDVVPCLLDAGRHVLLEKPFGLNLDDALSFIRLADEHAAVLMPAVQRRFHPSYRNWRAISPHVGDLIEASIELKIPHTATGWRSKPELAGGGALFDLGFHAVDIALQLFGDVKLVTSCFFDEDSLPYHGAADVKADLLLETETCAPVRVIVERHAPEKSERVQVRGSDGFLTMSRAEIRWEGADGRAGQASVKPDWSDAMREQLRDWAVLIERRRAGTHTFASPGWDGARAMRIMAEAYAHAKV